MKYTLKRYCFIMFLGIVIMLISTFPSEAVTIDQGTRIHFISLNSSTDAILLESNGHFGLVDSGEDWEYPDGTDPKYPLRGGISKGFGFEQQVIHYLKSKGVEKLDFYIATHAHSDHIGSGDEILDAFPTDRLYINRYDDSYIAKASASRLWDNQYVYDDLIDAAKRNGVQIITDLDLEENAMYRSFSLGEMKIDLMNLDRRKDELGNILPVFDDNENCIVTKVTAKGRTALLTADLDPTEGDTKRLADKLIGELWQPDVPPVEQSPEISASQEANVEYLWGNTEFDESYKNTGNTISIDLMKMNHHGADFNNTTYFLTSLNPKVAVVTARISKFSARQRECLPDANVFATASDSAAVVAEFTESGIVTDYVKLSPEWMEFDGLRYYFDENGRTFTDKGAHEIDGIPYCFDYSGAVERKARWAHLDGNWRWWLPTCEYYKAAWLNQNNKTYYFDEQGNAVKGWKQIEGNKYYFDKDCVMVKDAWIDNCYVGSDGKIVKGWKQIGSKWYYFNKDGEVLRNTWFGDYYLTENGEMATNSWIGDCYVDKSGVWVPNAVKDHWVKSGNRWWYLHTDGSYTKSNWEEINGKKYFFDASGWMIIGWRHIGSKWYYFNQSGAMATGWAKVGGTYYYFAGTGAMQTGWLKHGSAWYYLNSSGAMATGWQKIGASWYYLDGTGAMATGWTKIGKTWYYMNGSGVMQTGWQKISNKWYYLKGTGAMATGWTKVGKTWYYMNGSGVMQTGWQKISNKWYYLNSSGAMATGTRYINGVKYTFNSSGVML